LSGRDQTGRFAAGFCADRGRGFAATASQTVHAPEFRATVIELANAPVTIRSATGRARTISIFEAMVLRLATGQTSRRTSPIVFIRLVLECAPLQQDAVDNPVPPRPAGSESRVRLERLLVAILGDRSLDLPFVG
jgi:hypothetical protein